MSADKWTYCPRCMASARKKALAEHERVAALYGAVSVDEFDAARAALPPLEPELEPTFREDYEFYDAELGTVYASYGGCCTVCHLSVELKASKQFWPEST